MRPSETENEILISLASTLRNLSFFNKLASRSNTSRFCISTLLDFRDPLAVIDLSNEKGISDYVGVINANIGGTFTKPTIEIDTKSIVKQAVGNKVVEALAGKGTTEEQVANIREKAEEAGQKLVEAAEREGEKLVEKASNPVTKIAAKAAKTKLVEEAKKQADRLADEAEKQIRQLKGE